MTSSGNRTQETGGLSLDNPLGIRAEMARRGILPLQLVPYEDPERGYVDPMYGEEMRGAIWGFLCQLHRAIQTAEQGGIDGGSFDAGSDLSSGNQTQDRGGLSG